MTIQSFLSFNEEKLYVVSPIDYEDTKHFILNIHYAKRMPSISYAFGLFIGEELLGVVTYGTPASPNLCEGICGDSNKDNVLELNRLCLLNNKPNEASRLVSRSLKLIPKPKVIVSYADTAQKHTGIVYQACNFLFTGTTRERTDIASEDGKHSRHHKGDLAQRVVRSAKHRYIYFVGDKKQIKKLKSELRYEVLPFPKSE